jgi:hypothetical protein
MAHFNNGSERKGFQDHFCGRCANDRGDGCAVNLIYDVYDFGTTKRGEEDAQQIMDILIAERRDENDGKTISCSMFLEGASGDRREKETGDLLITKLLKPGVTAEKFQEGTLLTRNEAQA